jgi:hypothetical protein
MLPLLAELSRSARSEALQAFSPQGTHLLQVEYLLRLLAEHRVEYVLVGGLAMCAHGSAYVTEDMAVCYARTPVNIAAVAAACATIHVYMRGAPKGLPFHFDPPTIQAGLNFTLETDLGDIDFLGEVSGIGTYDRALALSDEKVLFGQNVRVLSLDGLLAAKNASGFGASERP